MKIAIVTAGRFHVLDLARELCQLGHEVAFYSMVPPWRTTRFGLPSAANRWLAPTLAPRYSVMRLARGTHWEASAYRAFNEALDDAALTRLEPCDVVIAMSGMCLRTLHAAKQKYGARVFVERASRHILSQKAILDGISNRAASAVPDWIVERELEEYAAADQVVVPARHVLESFIEQGFSERRIFVNPLGVALDKFLPQPSPPREPRCIVMAGAWSLRKGADVLQAAARQLKSVKVLHCGTIGDAEPGIGPQCDHLGFVPQSELPGHYSRAHVFALASREEGLAVVQMQAVACGLPLVCTDRTGGADLAPYLPEGALQVARAGDVDDFAAALERGLAWAQTHQAGASRRDLLNDNRQYMSWGAYARRWHEHLQ